MRTAVLLNGNIRTIDQCKNSIISCFEHLNPDYYVSTYFNQNGYHPWVQDLTNYYEDPIFSEKEIVDKFFDFNLKLIIIENIEKIKKLYKEEENKFNLNMKNLESSFLQYLKLKKGLDIIKNFENKNFFKYDLIIKTRCDLQHSNILKQISLSNIQNELIITSGNIFPNDLVLLSCRDNIFKVINFMIDEFYCYSNIKSNQNPPHGLLLAATEFTSLSIRKYDIIKYVARSNYNHYY